MSSKILQYILLRSKDHLVYYDNYEIVPSHDNILTARDYGRTITASIQPGYHYEIPEKQHEDRKTRIKAIMIVDDDPDTTLTFKKSLEAENYNSSNNIFVEVYTYSNPELALSEFKSNFYDLLLIDVNMPKMNGFELCTKLLEIDANPRICFMSSAEINHQGLREIYPATNIGCFIKKPVSIEFLVRKVKEEL
jgi:CheY-like chemotaxis protein